MIYLGGEKENHAGSYVKYYHGGKWYEGTLVEPVNYQIVITKENPPAILSCYTPVPPSKYEVERATENVYKGDYTEKDLQILSQNIHKDKYISEVESVIIIDK